MSGWPKVLLCSGMTLAVGPAASAGLAGDTDDGTMPSAAGVMTCRLAEAVVDMVSSNGRRRGPGGRSPRRLVSHGHLVIFTSICFASVSSLTGTVTTRIPAS